MSIAISNMVPITMPRFAPATSSTRAQESNEAVTTHGPNHGPNRVTPQQRDTGETLDFDLLAEYLLDDVTLPPLQDFYYSGNPPGAGTLASDVYGNERTTIGIAPGGSNSALKGHYNNDQHSFIGAARVDPLADAPCQLKQGQSYIPAGGGNVATDLHHVQQLIVHQVNANDNKMQPPFTTIEHKNYKSGSEVYTSLPESNMNHVMPSSVVPTSTYYGNSTAAPQNMSRNKINMQAPFTNKRRRTDLQVTNQQPIAPNGIINNANYNIQRNQMNNSTNITTTPTGHRQKQKSQAQIDRRRERNKILARRTRLRKKFFFESLQKEVTDLQKENAALRNIVQTKISDKDQVKAIFDKYKAAELPPIVMEELGMVNGCLGKEDVSLVKSLKTSQQCFIITDPSLQDNPIVYASDDFLNLTGYARDAVLGQNCRFLQGTDTKKSTVDKIRKGIEEGEDISVCLVNYTADGTSFWNQLFIAALRDTQNNIVNFIGVIVKVVGPSPDDPESDKIVPYSSNNNDESEDRVEFEDDLWNENGLDFDLVQGSTSGASKEDKKKVVKDGYGSVTEAAPGDSPVVKPSASAPAYTADL